MHDLARVGRQLHNRYEASCSYAWACTKRYEARTDRLEAAAQALAAAVNVRSELQRDPRGWPLILQLAGVRPVKMADGAELMVIDGSASGRDFGPVWNHVTAKLVSDTTPEWAWFMLPDVEALMEPDGRRELIRQVPAPGET